MRIIGRLTLLLYLLSNTASAQLSLHLSNEMVVINRNANVIISGDWHHHGIYQSSSGSLVFWGTDDQYIFSLSKKIVSDVTVLKSSGMLFLTDTLWISDSLQLIQGRVRSNRVAPVFILSSAVLAGGTKDSYIDGPLIRVFPMSATADSVRYPVGDSLDFRPVVIRSQRVDTDSIVLLIEQIHGDAKALSSVYEGVDQVSKIHYWKISQSGNGAWNSAQIILSYDTVGTDDGVELPEELRIAQLDTTVSHRWQNRGGTGSAAHAGVITSQTLSNFDLGWFTFGDASGGGDISLPVVLSSFELSAHRNSVYVSWKTESEFNNHCWFVQRHSGGEFETIATIEGKGTTSAATDYVYFDATVSIGKSYTYRLADMSYDGRVHMHEEKIITADLPKIYKLHSNYPNPFNGQTTILYDLPFSSDVELSLFNVLGQKVIQLIHAKQEAGYYHVIWDGRNARGEAVASGLYIMRMQARNLTDRKASGFIKTKKMMLLK